MMDIEPLLGLAGGGACVYSIHGAIATLLNELFNLKHRIITSQWAESHTKMVVILCTADSTLEDLSEFVMETLEPFVN